MKTYKKFNNEEYKRQVLTYIRKRDLYSLIELVESSKLSLECINLILLDIYKLVRNRKKEELKKVEELVLLTIEQGGDVNQHDNEGYSLLMNSLYISELTVKRVLEAGADLRYKNTEQEDNLDIFEYVSNLIGTPKWEKLYRRLYNSLKEVYPELYRTKMKTIQKKKFNI